MLAYILFFYNLRGIVMYKDMFRLNGFGGKDTLILGENVTLYLSINERNWVLPAFISHFDDREHY